MSNNSNQHSNGSDDSEMNTGLPFSRRGIFAATGLAGLGLAGSTAVGAQDDDDSNGPENAPFAAHEHDESAEKAGHFVQTFGNYHYR